MAYQVTYLPQGYGTSQRVDLTLYARDVKATAQRNTVGQLTFSISVRTLWKIFGMAADSSYLNPWLSCVQLSIDGLLAFTGFLASMPERKLDASDDDMDFTFVDGLGLLKGWTVKPYQSLNGALNTLLRNQVSAAVTWSKSHGVIPWPVSLGHNQALASVQWVVDSPINLFDFVTQRTDNTSGAGFFDVSVSPDMAFNIYSSYSSVGQTFLFGSGGNLQSIDFPEWDAYATAAYMTGNGNGFPPQGTTLTATASNAEAKASMMAFEQYSQDSSISVQSTLNSQAAKSIKYANSPFLSGSMSFVASMVGLTVAPHETGGDMWLGDTVSVGLSEPFATHFPELSAYSVRVDSVELDFDSNTGDETVTVGLLDPDGGTVTNG